MKERLKITVVSILMVRIQNDRNRIIVSISLPYFFLFQSEYALNQNGITKNSLTKDLRC